MVLAPVRSPKQHAWCARSRRTAVFQLFDSLRPPLLRPAGVLFQLSLTSQMIMKRDVDIREDVYASVLLPCGTTIFQGLVRWILLHTR